MFEMKLFTEQNSMRDYVPLKPFIKEVISTQERLGIGAYGSVEIVQIKNKSGKYAAKRFRSDYKPEQKVKFFKKFVTELQLLSSLKHKNIVRYIGCCFMPDCELPLLIMELLQLDLHEFLLHRKKDLKMAQKIRILYDVITGINFLHNQNPAIIHRDLTAKNVLLDSVTPSLAKIADFGNSRVIEMDPTSTLESMTCTPGTLVYMPPEALSQHSKYTEKIDIFSFGHLSLFTVIEEFPYELGPPTYFDAGGDLLASTEVNRRKIYINKLFDFLDQNVKDVIYELITMCLHNKPSNRPSAIKIQQDLERLVPLIPTISNESVQTTASLYQHTNSSSPVDIN